MQSLSHGICCLLQGGGLADKFKSAVGLGAGPVRYSQITAVLLLTSLALPSGRPCTCCMWLRNCMPVSTDVHAGLCCRSMGLTRQGSCATRGTPARLAHTRWDSQRQAVLFLTCQPALSATAG